MAAIFRLPWIMLDVAMVALILVCFALAWAYASFCDRLLALPASKDVSL